MAPGENAGPAAVPVDEWELVREHAARRALGFPGEPAVAVLELNLALDRVGS